LEELAFFFVPVAVIVVSIVACGLRIERGHWTKRKDHGFAGAVRGIGLTVG
jgi:hypothetical protein